MFISEYILYELFHSNFSCSLTGAISRQLDDNLPAFLLILVFLRSKDNLRESPGPEVELMLASHSP